MNFLSEYRYFIDYKEPKLFFGEQKKLLDWKIGESLILMDLDRPGGGWEKMVAESEILRKVYTIISNHILHDQSMSYGVSNERASNSESVGVSFERFWP